MNLVHPEAGLSWLWHLKKTYDMIRRSSNGMVGPLAFNGPFGWPFKHHCTRQGPSVQCLASTDFKEPYIRAWRNSVAAEITAAKGVSRHCHQDSTCQVYTVLGLNLTRDLTGDHTSYLSRAPRIYSCKFFLAGVNFFRFNAKIWQFTVYFAVITQKIGNLLCILP